MSVCQNVRPVAQKFFAVKCNIIINHFLKYRKGAWTHKRAYNIPGDTDPG